MKKVRFWFNTVFYKYVTKGNNSIDDNETFNQEVTDGFNDINKDSKKEGDKLNKIWIK